MEVWDGRCHFKRKDECIKHKREDGLDEICLLRVDIIILKIDNEQN